MLAGNENAAAIMPAVLMSTPYTLIKYCGSHNDSATNAPKTKK